MKCWVCGKAKADEDCYLVMGFTVVVGLAVLAAALAVAVG